MRFILLMMLLVPFIWTSKFYAQELTPVFENITEGLPSTEVHDMFQDSIGYMWFATDRGICRYNGDEMKIIDTDKDINTNVFFKFFKETETKVWLLTKQHSLFSFNPLEAQPKFRPHPKNEEIMALISTTNCFPDIRHVYIQNDNFTILFRRAPGYLYIPKYGKCKWLFQQKNACLNLWDFQNTEIRKANDFYYVQLQPSESHNSSHRITINNHIIRRSIPSIPTPHNYGISDQIESKNVTYLASINELIKIETNSVSHINVSSYILCLLASNGLIYVGTYSGIFVYDKHLNLRGRFLEGQCITKLFLDKNENLWTSTIQSGLFKSENIDVLELKFSFSFGNTGFFHLSENLLLYDKIKLEGLILSKDFRIKEKIARIDIRKDRIVTNNRNLIPYTKALRQVDWNYDKPNSNPWKLNLVHKDFENSYRLYDRNICFLDGRELQVYHHINENIHPTFCVEHSKDLLFVGSLNGLFTFDLKTNHLSKHPIRGTKGIQFNDFVKLNGKIIIASNKGIYLFKNKRFDFLSSTENIIGKAIYKINASSCWIWNDHFVYKLKMENGAFKISKEPYFSVNNTNVINALIEFNDKLWISTKKGIQIIDLATFSIHKNKNKLEFIPDSMRIDGTIVPLNSEIRIREGNSVSFFFSTICFDKLVDRTLEYSIDGVTWFETSKKNIALSALKDGDYVLQIRKASNPSQILYSVPIHVSKIWYKSNWFVTLCAMLGIIITFGLFVQYYKSREKKRNEELEKLNLELKLLTSKMNPHFTFNTINSIQYYILKSDKKEAIQYLSDFALLIRKSLDFSMAERITVEEEIHFLSLYVKMENKRFDANFQLKCNLEPPESILTKKIPSMLIQPLVENIILHAGYEDSEDKIVEINIRFEQGYFTIQIIDYGKGITAKNNLNKHKSYGIDILKSRVKIYNGADYKDSDVRIDSTPQGTTVTLKLKEWKQ